MTGFVGQRPVYEKNITLAVAKKLGATPMETPMSVLRFTSVCNARAQVTGSAGIPPTMLAKSKPQSSWEFELKLMFPVRNVPGALAAGNGGGAKGTGANTPGERCASLTMLTLPLIEPA